jgi:hypothetical protein
LPVVTCLAFVPSGFTTVIRAGSPVANAIAPFSRVTPADREIGAATERDDREDNTG